MNGKRGRHSIRPIAATTAALLAASVFGIGTVASADPVRSEPRISAETVAQSLDSASDLLVQPIRDADEQSGAVNLGGGSISLPSDVQSDVVMKSDSGAEIRLGLPEDAGVGAAETPSPGVTSYLGKDSATSVLVADFGVQFVTTIANAAAPSRYQYDVTLSAGQHLATTEAGLPAVFNADGGIDVIVASPWAQDASGKTVSTHYQVTGSTLTQVVDHGGSSEIAYPVTADPIWIAPWIAKCLMGIGLKASDIAKIAELGTPSSILLAFGRAAVACIFGK